jgi:hypothetical protein
MAALHDMLRVRVHKLFHGRNVVEGARSVGRAAPRLHVLKFPWLSQLRVSKEFIRLSRTYLTLVCHSQHRSCTVL